MKWLICLLVPLCLFAQEELVEPSKQRILYTAQTQTPEQAIPLYLEYKAKIGRHDFEILQQMATLWIEQKARSPVAEKQILGLYAFGFAGISVPMDILEQALLSADARVQISALQSIRVMQEDHSEFLLNKAMASQFVDTRLEAASILAQRKSPSATGQIESLMYRFPPYLRFFFPEFFAVIGTHEAIHILRHLMDDSVYTTKTRAILNAAIYGRDDLLPAIRAAVTHLNNAEQEASAMALGYLKDMRSIKKLKKLTDHACPSVRLAALSSLHLLSDPQASAGIAKEAQEGNLFAIELLSGIPKYDHILLSLLTSPDKHVRFNAAFSLLQQKNPKSLPSLLEFLIKDSKDLGFERVSSVGGTLHAWKVLSSLNEHAQNSPSDIRAITQFLRERLVVEAVELPEEDFLQLVDTLLSCKQNSLVPVIASLLENTRSPKTIALLKKYSQQVGAPLIRAYCNLTLFRLKEPGPYQEAVFSFLEQNRSQELIRLRDPIPWNLRFSDQYHLTPEENSSLIIQSYQTIIEKQGVEGIDLLLAAMEKGHPDNIPILCSILLRMLY